jgi:hypothetical protein
VVDQQLLNILKDYVLQVMVYLVLLVKYAYQTSSQQALQVADMPHLMHQQMAVI